MKFAINREEIKNIRGTHDEFEESQFGEAERLAKEGKPYTYEEFERQLMKRASYDPSIFRMTEREKKRLYRKLIDSIKSVYEFRHEERELLKEEEDFLRFKDIRTNVADIERTLRVLGDEFTRYLEKPSEITRITVNKLISYASGLHDVFSRVAKISAYDKEAGGHLKGLLDDVSKMFVEIVNIKRIEPETRQKIMRIIKSMNEEAYGRAVEASEAKKAKMGEASALSVISKGLAPSISAKREAQMAELQKTIGKMTGEMEESGKTFSGRVGKIDESEMAKLRETIGNLTDEIEEASDQLHEAVATSDGVKAEEIAQKIKVLKEGIGNAKAKEAELLAKEAKEALDAKVGLADDAKKLKAETKQAEDILSSVLPLAKKSETLLAKFDKPTESATQQDVIKTLETELQGNLDKFNQTSRTEDDRKMFGDEYQKIIKNYSETLGITTKSLQGTYSAKYNPAYKKK